MAISFAKSKSNCILCYAEVTFHTKYAVTVYGKPIVLDRFWSPCKCDGDPVIPDAISKWALEMSVA